MASENEVSYVAGDIAFQVGTQDDEYEMSYYTELRSGG